MKKNIIIVGDSFCLHKDKYKPHWPSLLARKLNLDLIHYSVPGGHWWPIADFLLKVSTFAKENAEVLVVAHTNSDRIPSKDETLFRPNLIENPKTEQDTAMVLYKKYIEDQEFLYWAHKQWILELERHWPHTKIIHLNCYPWSINFPFSGVSVVPPLINLSLNELGPDANFYSTTEQESRHNHFNSHNNKALADELERLIKDYTPGKHYLDISKFEQNTDKWTNWEWKDKKHSYLDTK